MHPQSLKTSSFKAKWTFLDICYSNISLLDINFCSGYDLKNTLKWVAYEKQELISYSSIGWEDYNQETSRSDVWVRPASPPTNK